MPQYLYVVALSPKTLPASFVWIPSVGFQSVFLIAANEEDAYQQGYATCAVPESEGRLNDYVVEVPA